MTDYQYYPKATIVIIAITVIVGVVGGLGENGAVNAQLLISNYLPQQVGYFYEVQQGEFWRLLSPVLLHFGALHLFMNMVWMYMLGSRIEASYTPMHILAMTVVFGLAGNLLQYFLEGPGFGGMSGVVYGMLAYTWAHGRWMPRARVAISDQIMVFMLVWGVFSILAGFAIAHWAHAGGALAGIAWAKLESERAKKKRFGR